MTRSDKRKARAEARAKAKWEREAERRAKLCYTVESGGQDHGLSPPEIQTLQAIAVGERTWTDVASLGQVGLNGTTLHGLIEVGWVEPFLTEDGEVITLSSWAVEALGLDVVEHWEVFSGVAEQEDCSGERTRMHVREPHEIPRWNSRPPPLEPGMPRPKPRPIRLPTLYRLSRLPEDVVKGLLARTIVDPVEEAMKNEEQQRAADREEWLTEQARLEDGRLAVDERTGQVKIQPILLWASPAKDGLRGGLATSHNGKIPVAKPRGRAGKKKRRRRPA